MIKCDYETKFLNRSQFVHSNGRGYYQRPLSHCTQQATTVWKADPNAGPDVTYHLDPALVYHRCQEHPVRGDGWLSEEVAKL